MSCVHSIILACLRHIIHLLVLLSCQSFIIPLAYFNSFIIFLSYFSFIQTICIPSLTVEPFSSILVSSICPTSIYQSTRAFYKKSTRAINSWWTHSKLVEGISVNTWWARVLCSAGAAAAPIPVALEGEEGGGRCCILGGIREQQLGGLGAAASVVSWCCVPHRGWHRDTLLGRHLHPCCSHPRCSRGRAWRMKARRPRWRWGAAASMAWARCTSSLRWRKENVIWVSSSNRVLIRTR
jgi:hypothetical protein